MHGYERWDNVAPARGGEDARVLGYFSRLALKRGAHYIAAPSYHDVSAYIDCFVF